MPERYPTGTNPYVEGHVDARKLFGTPEENGMSVVRAVARNFPAFLDRVAASLRQIPRQLMVAYGEPVGSVIVILLWVWGALVISTSRSSERRALIALGWPLHLGAYLITFFRSSYFLLPCAAVLAVASIGAKSLLRPFHLSRGTARVAAVGLLGAAVVLHVVQHPVSKPRVGWGNTPSERAILFVQQSFPRDARIAAYAPAPVWAARGEYVTLILNLRTLQTSRELQQWLIRENIAALYVEN